MGKSLVVIGGGAAGFFMAINAKEQCPDLDVMILEQSKEVLNKVRISGGGRCNVTNSCSDPKELVGHYPRGNKELLGPFYKFNTLDTWAWFETRGVALKTEEDGRVFPQSDDSADIANCLIKSTKKLGIKIYTSTKVMRFGFKKGSWELETPNQKISCDYLMLAAGSSKMFWDHLTSLGVAIVSPVPSLFTFQCKDTRLRGLSGIAAENVSLTINNTQITTQGPLLITHQGMSGPAVLKSSAWGAVELAEKGYHFEIIIDWIPAISEDEFLMMAKENNRKKILGRSPYIANRLWEQLLDTEIKDKNLTFGQASKVLILTLYHALKHSTFSIHGKNTFKEEFVTAGGINLQEVDFKGFFLKKHPTIFAAGEVLNIDGVTGGFNFQAAWTGGYLAACHLASLHKKE